MALLLLTVMLTGLAQAATGTTPSTNPNMPPTQTVSPTPNNSAVGTVTQGTGAAPLSQTAVITPRPTIENAQPIQDRERIQPRQ